MDSYRVLVDGKLFKYISIDPGVYDVKDLTRRRNISMLRTLSRKVWKRISAVTKGEEGITIFQSPRFNNLVMKLNYSSRQLQSH
jgi:hypothetical protein